MFICHMYKKEILLDEINLQPSLSEGFIAVFFLDLKGLINSGPWWMFIMYGLAAAFPLFFHTSPLASNLMALS